MDQLKTNDNATQATALVGLRLAKPAAAAVGEAPTVEEFSALYDGSLETTRRAQILSHITAAPEVYRSFLEITAAQVLLDESLAEQLVSKKASPALSQRILGGFANLLRMPVLSGGMVAAALVAVLLLPGQETADTGSWSEIEQIYTEFGNNWQTSPGTLVDASVRGVSSKTDAPAELQAIYLGLREGLATLGDEFPEKWLPTLSVDESLDSLPTELRDALEATGKLATLARFQCQLEGSDAFFVAAQTSLDNLRPSLDIQPTKTMKRLARVIDQPGSPRERVCDFSNATVAVFTSR